MSQHTDSRHNEDSLSSQQEATQAVERLLTLSPPTIRRTVQVTNRKPNQTTDIASPPGAVVDFLASMTSHYNTLSNSVTPHLFVQLCKDYNARKFEETSFYVAAYRLFFETGASHLIPGLRAFLPATWREVDLGWLNSAIEGDSERQRGLARKTFGGLAAMVETGMSKPKTPAASAIPPKTLGIEVESTPPSKQKKKRTPINGFRATYRTDLEDPTTPSRSAAPTLTSGSDTKSAYQSSSGTSASPTSSRSPKDSISPPTKKLTHRNKNNAPSTTTPTHSGSDNRDTPQPPTSSPDAPPPVDKQSKLPPASTIPHIGPIYPTTRAIIARSHKPYVHALCGQIFGHPAEVQRHHNGQGGRPGCWEKSGKPEGDDGRWDKHDSCKVKLSDVEYVKVQEGWVVTNWGSVSVEGLREGVGIGGVSKGGTAKLSIGKAGEGKKRKIVAKPQRPVPEIEHRAIQSESESESDSADEDAEDVDKYMDLLTPEEPGAKRQRILKLEEDTDVVFEELAAVRAAALGLRTRK